MSDTPQQMQQGIAARQFEEQAEFYIPMNRSNYVENTIANHNWRAIVIGAHEVDRIAEESQKFAVAFRGDCFIFETKDAHDAFFKKAHPVAGSQVSMGTLGYIDQTADGKSHPIFGRVDCVVCIGHPQSKIIGDIRKENKNIMTDPIDLDVLIAEKEKRKQSYNQAMRGPLPV